MQSNNILPIKNQTPPWHSILEFIPKGFILNDNGLYLDKNEPILLSGACWVSALTEPYDSGEWGMMIHWIDHNGKEHKQAFPSTKIIEDGFSVLSALSGLGLHIVPSQKRHLRDYLAGFQLPKELRIKSVSKLGWLSSNKEPPTYIFPEKTISIGKQSNVIFQPEENSNVANTMTCRGTLEQWSNFIAMPCRNNPLLEFALCISFASPLLKFANLESGGFHLYGSSSQGKTTALQVAASVWGCGGDPAESENSYINKWNTTGNALEGTASACNDGLLTLDEMGTCSAYDFGKVIYDLIGGQSKARMSKNITLRQKKTWRIMALSTGEISTQQKIEETGKKMLEGHGVRMFDVPINDGILIEPHGKKPSDAINSLKRYSSQFHGVAGREFIKYIVSLEPTTKLLSSRIKIILDQSIKSLSDNRKLNTIQQRVIQRFALCLSAGFLAIDSGILSLTKNELTLSIQTIIDNWLNDEASLPIEIKGVKSLQNFFIANQNSRFKNTNLSFHQQIQKLYGYIHYYNGHKLVLFTDEGLKEALKGYDQKKVLNELKKQNVLHFEHGKFKKKITVDGTRSYFFALNYNFLESYQ